MLDEIKKRLGIMMQRNPGPWLLVDRGGMGYDVDPLEPGIRGQFNNREDAEFVAHAITDIQWLIEEVERLRSKQYGPCPVCQTHYADPDGCVNCGHKFTETQSHS